MVRLLLPSHLSDSINLQPGRSPMRIVLLDPGSWMEIVQEIRERYPRLAERVLTDSGATARGFALVLNDAILQSSDSSLRFSSGDEISIIAMIAGG